ncbi:kinase-like domain-containing protein [Xylaria arbuscula]|nr:kinase-like domain-containing protein [Xylaria arbuscula]
MIVGISDPVCRSYESNDVSYEITATTFKKTSRLPFNDPYPDGTPFTWFRSLNHERITNEATALVLVCNKTTIPVPRLFKHGQLPNGRRYLVTDCLKRAGQKHTEDTPCKICLNQAHSNALDFIANIVVDGFALIDWEHAGYFPPGMERWPGTLDMQAYRKQANNLPEAITKFLLEDYLECYAGWGNKEELRTLINAGELPDSSRLI